MCFAEFYESLRQLNRTEHKTCSAGLTSPAVSHVLTQQRIGTIFLFAKYSTMEKELNKVTSCSPSLLIKKYLKRTDPHSTLCMFYEAESTLNPKTETAQAVSFGWLENSHYKHYNSEYTVRSCFILYQQNLSSTINHKSYPAQVCSSSL